MQSADTPVEKLADISPKKLARIIVDNRTSVFTLLGSATCPNTHADIIRKASEHGKIITMRSPFHDSTLEPGHYAAGSALKGSNIPQVKSTDSFVKAKLNYLLHWLRIETQHKEGLGEVVAKDRQDQIYALMSQNMVGEWFE